MGTRPNIQIPHILTEAVRNGRAVLLTGPDASKDCVNAKGEAPPDDARLRDILSEKFMGKKMPNRTAQNVAQMAIENGAGYSVVYETVNAAFLGRKTSEAYRLVADFNWRAIATTNIDTFLEEAYSDPKRRRQALIPFVKDDEPVDDRLRQSSSPVPFLKLHGCINHRLDPDIPLILSWEQYDQFSQNRKRLFQRLNDIAHESTMIFAGYSMADDHIRQLVHRLDAKNRSRWYIVANDAEEEDIRFWGSRNIEVIKCRFQDFMTALNAALPALLRYFAPSPEAAAFPLRAYYASEMEESEAVRSALAKDLTLIHSGMPVSEQSAERFYSGYDTGFGAILKHLDARRKVTDDLLFKALLELDAPSEPSFFVLRGPGGSGKTIALKRTAFDAATANNALVLWLRDAGQLRSDVFLEISDLVRRPIYLFVDEVALHADKITSFLKTMKLRKIPIILIGAEREADWATYCEHLEDALMPHFLRVGTLQSAEVENLLDLLERHSCLGELGGKKRSEQVEAFMAEEKANRQLLVALHVLTRGLPFEKIVLKEFEAIQPERARLLYLDIATMNQFGVPVRAGTVSRASGIDFREYEENFFAPLKDIISTAIDPYTQDYIYKTRHPRVAEIVFRQVCIDDALKASQFIHIIGGFDVGFSSDSRALEGICRGRSLTDAFSDAEHVRSIYRAAVDAAPKLAYLNQQWAIFESTHAQGDLLEAERLAEVACEAEPRIAAFLHTRAEVSRKRAKRESSPVLKEQLRRLARKYLDKMTSGDRFAVSSRCKLLVDEVEDFGDTISATGRESDDRAFALKLKDATSALTRAQQDFPDDPELVEIEARLWSELKDKERALSALERAWKKLPRHMGVAVRIGQIYAAAGRREDQYGILKEALDRDPDDREVHMAMALFVLSAADPDLVLAETHLRQSFVQGDQNFEARHLLAQLLFHRGDLGPAESQFEDIDKRAPKEFRKFAPRTENAITRLLPTYPGIIEKVGQGFFFLRTGSYPSNIYAHRSSFNEALVDEIEVGRRVDFRIRFNRKGPVAMEVSAH
ncbi:SIR2 family NAD-dependent protein deacylase [Rhizobium leguminosarum]|uniref:SIR2 family NAD-dependent protein deacylase n=1 Tax=Rhizobium leguminosarum TaxID=384 RepID=UPI0013EE816A|nr:SIR2 family protein [Rhizobium leguminosarum]